ncbi:MAG: MBL fold metallo-hydrolase [Rubricella sp.]
MRGEGEDSVDHPFPEAPAPGDAIEIAEGVLWARLPLPMALDHVNIYAFDDGDGWTLVDTGLNWAKGRDAMDALRAGPLAGRPVRRIILTHHHPDHVGLVGAFAEEGAEIVATRTAWLTARMLTLDVQDTLNDRAERFYRRAGMAPEILEKRRAERPFNFSDVVHPIPLGFSRIEEGDHIEIGGRRWEIRLGQGHAPDQATFWSAEAGLALTADQILPGISPNLGVYPTEPDADPVGEWIDSCARLLRRAERGLIALPGHKLPFTGVRARLRQLIQNHESALARLLAALDTPRSAGECFGPLYGREIAPGEYGLALVEAIGHLNHLHRTDAVRRIEASDGTWRYQRR